MGKLAAKLRSMPTMGADDEKLSVNLGLRVTEEDYQRIEALAEKITALGKHMIVRQALRIGLKALEADPTLALGIAVEKSKPAPK